MTLDPRVSRWFEERRGITPATVGAFGIFTEGHDVVFPYPGDLLKRRYSVEEDNPFGLEKTGRRFVWRDADGGPASAGQAPFLPPGYVPKSRIILCEGETDTMAVWQNIPDDRRDHVEVVGLSGVGSWEAVIQKYPDLFGDAQRVFVVFDNDDPYSQAHDAVDLAWSRIKKHLGRRARRVKLPQGVEDVADFFQTYDWSAFELLLSMAAEAKLNYVPLDLSREPKDPDWLLDNFIAIPDITVLWGDGGVSKSLWLMGLAVAIAEGHDSFCGMPVNKHGRVVYVDEENPEDVVLSRLKKLGLTERGQENLTYFWWPNVHLDTEPEKLIEDVAELEPVMLALDSFSRLSLADENDVQAMNSVFNKGIYPISRDLGVGVIALHHANKQGMIRGATAIRNAADLSINVQRLEEAMQDQYQMFPDKPRRGQSRIVNYKVTGWNSLGEETQILDEEVRVTLEPATGVM